MIAWKLKENTCRLLAKWNAKNLARITGRTIPEEHPTETCDLVKSVRKWRMKWVRHILRKEDSFLLSEEDADADAKALRGSINPAGFTATRH